MLRTEKPLIPAVGPCPLPLNLSEVSTRLYEKGLAPVTQLFFIYACQDPQHFPSLSE